MMTGRQRMSHGDVEEYFPSQEDRITRMHKRLHFNEPPYQVSGNNYVRTSSFPTLPTMATP